MCGLSFRLSAVVVIAVLLLGAGSVRPDTSSAARRGDTERTASELRRVLSPAGTRGSLVVQDGRSRRIIDLRGSRLRPLGSTAKLFTAAAVLERFDPDLSTRVLATTPIGDDGVLNGDLFLLGGGDPSFGTNGFTRGLTGSAGTDGDVLAARLVGLGLREVRGAVVGDERLFDDKRSTRPGGGFDAELDGVLGGLTWNRGRAGDTGGPLSDPARAAAAAFDDRLEARGVTIRGVPRAGATPPDAVIRLGEALKSASSLVLPMLKRSDDFYAESMAKGLGARSTGAPGTTASGARAVGSAVRRLGVRPRLVDGSGLSARSRGTARDLVRLLQGSRGRSWGTKLMRALPVAGRDGTLRTRLRSVRGRCRAKTGSLGSRASALAGTCRTRGRTTVTFAVLIERMPQRRARALVDRVATTLARAPL